MNQFHHASIEKAFSRLALSAEQQTLSANIGGRITTWTLSSVSAARALLEPLQRQMFASLERIDATCREFNVLDDQSNVISSVEAFEVV